MSDEAPIDSEELPHLLLVDDDETFTRVMARAMARRGFRVSTASSAEAGLALAREDLPEYAVLDLKMEGDSGLVLLPKLLELDAEMRVVILTGYSSIATAVEAIKLGACHYLAKPSNTDDIEAAFGKAEGNAGVVLGERPTSIKTLEWERIHEVLAETGFNVSETARRLGMHRRTLARKLGKQQVK